MLELTPMMWQQGVGLFLSVSPGTVVLCCQRSDRWQWRAKRRVCRCTRRAIGSERDNLAGMRPATARFFVFFLSLLPIPPLSLGLTIITAYCRESFKENREGERKKDKT